jgi:hypothetical protein
VILSDKAADKYRSLNFYNCGFLEGGGASPLVGVSRMPQDAWLQGMLRNHGRSHLAEGPSNPGLAFALMVGQRRRRSSTRLGPKCDGRGDSALWCMEKGA